MVWDLIQVVLLTVLVIVYAFTIYQNNALIRYLEEQRERDKRLIQAYKELTEAYAKERELLFREEYEMIGHALTLETERDRYLDRCVLLEDENGKLKKILDLYGVKCGCYE